jgi:adenylate cyclase class 2
VDEEIEAKIRVVSPDAFCRAIEARRLPCAGTVFEANRLFDDAGETLRARGAALRLRVERPEGGGPERARLTYKGPQAESDLKIRPEFETEVGDAEALTRVLEALGLGETFYYEKRRTTWHAGTCEVTLDEVPHLGWFAEVEGPTEEAVRQALRSLGLDQEPTITASYIHLLHDRLEELGKEPTRAAFEA